MEGLSLLDQPVTLAEIIDQDSLQRVCMTFTRQYDAGLAVIDSRGQALVDVPADYLICRRIGEHPRGGDVCGSFDELMRTEALGEAPVAKDCLCGLRYLMLAITHQGALLGRLIYGPFRPEGLEVLPQALIAHLDRQVEAKDAERCARVLAGAQRGLGKIATQSDIRANRAIRSVAEVLSVIVQTGYARHLTSQIHIAAIQDAYNELQEKNRRLADSLDKLKELDKLKSNFLATVSHELRTPLTSVIGYSEMLLEGLAGDLSREQRDYVQTIMDKGDQLLQIISEILDISKIESGAVQLNCEQVNIGDLLRQVSDAMMPQARRKNIALRYDSTAGVPTIVADRAKTRQILLNLLSNAIKFTPDGGAVSAEAKKSEFAPEGTAAPTPAVEIRVIDSGVGIPLDSRDRVFEAFYQVDNSSTRTHGGTGLGLSIVKHFVEAHGGSVWVEAPEEPDERGSIFVVRIPLKPPQSATVTVANPQSQLVG